LESSGPADMMKTAAWSKPQLGTAAPSADRCAGGSYRAGVDLKLEGVQRLTSVYVAVISPRAKMPCSKGQALPYVGATVMRLLPHDLVNMF
jgi:hypothetical protein